MNNSIPQPSRLLRFYAAFARWIFGVVLALALLLIAGWGALHGWIVPRIGEFRPQLEMRASKALGVPVRIGAISAHSEGIVPSFELHDLSVLDPSGREAVHLSRVLATLSPASLWRRGFDQITIEQPRLDVRRSAEGRIFVAGLDLSRDDASGGGQTADWLFSQTEIVVRGGKILWTDELRSAPLLGLQDVDIVLRNSARRHAIRVDATPPEEWGARFSVVGQFRQPLLVTRAGNWQEWAGQAYADFPRVDVSQLRRHFRPGDLGTELAQGKGALRLWADVRAGALEGAVADVALDSVSATLGTGLQPLELKSVQGRFTGRRLAKGFSFASKGLQFQTAEGLQWPGGNVAVTYTGREGRMPAYGELHADRLDLAALRQVANRLPLGEATHTALAAYRPSGLVEVLDATWQGPLEMPEKYQARGRVTGLAIASQVAAAKVADMHAVGTPGVRGANVDFDLNQRGGRAAVDIKRGAFDLPGVFDESVLPFDEFVADTRWQVDGQNIALQMDNVRFSNADAQGKMRLGWHTSDPDESGAKSRFPGVLDLSGSLSRGQGVRVYRYLPRVLGADVNAYVRDAVQAGAITSAQFRVKGDLHDLPFTDPKKGEFHIAAQVKNAVYAYVPPRLQPAGALPWPALTQLSGDLVFDRASMRIKSSNARFAGMPDTRILQADAVIEDLNHSVVNVTADVRGPLTEALGLMASSPLAEMSGHALAKATATGVADYRLRLGLPINDIDHSTVEGSVTLAGNDVRIMPDTPLLARAKGVVGFTEKGFSLNAVQARLLGGDVRLDGGLQAGTGVSSSSTLPGSPLLLVRAQGVASAEGLRQARELGLLSRLAEHASGTAAYNAVLGLRRGVPELQLTSSLQGMALDLPAPLQKPAEAVLALRFDNSLLPESATGTGTAPLLDQVRLTLGNLASVLYVRDVSGASARVQQGAILLGAAEAESPLLPAAGVAAHVDLPALDVDAWRELVGNATASSPQVSLASVDNSGYLPASMALRVQELKVAGRTLHDVVLGTTRSGSTWRANATARELEGYLEYRQAGAGGVFARLARLRIPASATTDVESLLDTQPGSMPALDVVVDELELGGHKLGRVEVDAVNRVGMGGSREWRLNRLAVRVPEAEMNATGKWSVSGPAHAGAEAPSRTSLDFTMDIADSGDLLKRFGMPDVVRRGKGQMQGTLGWNGSPLALHYPSMTGQLNVNIASGQFLKADPGLAKLLGVLSLQALPRRLALDFRDVFSEGFAFDFVRGDVTMAQGIASTNNMQMRGVNAAVLMEGSADVDKETQALRVVVVPELNTGTASLVAAVINPAIGLGTFLAQAFLRGPLIEAATREFQVDGSWAEPRITRITGRERSGATKVGVNP